MKMNKMLEKVSNMLFKRNQNALDVKDIYADISKFENYSTAQNIEFDIEKYESIMELENNLRENNKEYFATLRMYLGMLYGKKSETKPEDSLTISISNAIKHFNSALEFFTLNNNKRLFVFIQENLGVSYGNLFVRDGKIENLMKADKVYQEVINTGYYKENTRIESEIYERIAKINRKMSEIEEKNNIKSKYLLRAIYANEKILKNYLLNKNIFALIEKRLEINFLLTKIIDEEVEEHNYKALKDYDEILKVLTEENNPVCNALIYNNIGNIYSRFVKDKEDSENIGKALDFYNKSEKLLSENITDEIHKIIKDNRSITLLKMMSVKGNDRNDELIDFLVSQNIEKNFAAPTKINDTKKVADQIDNNSIKSTETIDENRLNRIRTGAKDVFNKLLHGMKTNDGRVHIQSLLCAIGSLAGYSCQESVRSEYIYKKGFTEKEVFSIVETKSGEKYYFGDRINNLLVVGNYSIWSLTAGAVLHLGEKELINIDEVFRYVTKTIGTENFGVLRSINKPGDSTSNYVRGLWNVLQPTIKLYCNDSEWPILFGLAIQETIFFGKDILNFQEALSIVMESAISMSKINLINKNIA